MLKSYIKTSYMFNYKDYPPPPQKKTIFFDFTNLLNHIKNMTQHSEFRVNNVNTKHDTILCNDTNICISVLCEP